MKSIILVMDQNRTDQIRSEHIRVSGSSHKNFIGYVNKILYFNRGATPDQFRPLEEVWTMWVFIEHTQLIM